MSHLKFLDESNDEQGLLRSPLLPEHEQVVLPAEDGAPTPTTELKAYWSRRHEEALARPDMQTLLQDRLKNYQLSPTHLNDFTDLVHCGPQGFFLKTILRFPQAPHPDMQFGNAMHETLEWLQRDFQQTGLLPSEKLLADTFEKRLQAKKLSDHDTELYAARGKEALAVYLQQRAHTLGTDNVVEYNFRNEGVFLGKAHLAGKIDKMIIDPQARTIQIVDYKTGRSFNRWTRDVKLHKYQQQLYLYRALIEGSHTYAGYTVTDAYLEFVEPDEDGRIVELHLAFDEQEYQRVKRLAEVVWKRITTLQLPDVSAFTPDMNGVELFEEDLLG